MCGVDTSRSKYPEQKLGLLFCVWPFVEGSVKTGGVREERAEENTVSRSFKKFA